MASALSKQMSLLRLFYSRKIAELAKHIEQDLDADEHCQPGSAATRGATLRMATTASAPRQSFLRPLLLRGRGRHTDRAGRRRRAARLHAQDVCRANAVRGVG